MTNPQTTSLWQTFIHQAQALGAQARFAEMLGICRSIADAHANNTEAMLSLGSLLQSFGYLSMARRCFLHGRTLEPSDLRPLVNLANVARETGNHREARQLYDAILKQLPDHPLIQRNAVLGLEYDPDATSADRKAKAQSWGAWATAQAGGPRPRPAWHSPQGRSLRLGYVSADFCQHTVGLLCKHVLAAHNPARVAVFAYSAGSINDWVTAGIRRTCLFRDVAALIDVDLAALIRADEIDVLIDLSGHTAGSRLAVFAHRPAPVQVSWLGYFATTGLSAMDAVLMDDCHAPAGAEEFFSERVVRLSHGRFCYTPAPWAPAPAEPPAESQGHITFGCFNNTAKLNPSVLALWARILREVPNARLILKWRSFQDDAFCDEIQKAFIRENITPERVEMRGASFHKDVLAEYADIDIALDPFPFTGGLTSCEALWMGVPVVTWPQSRAVSRQSLALLSAIGLEDLAATDADHYVAISVKLAGDATRRARLRQELRQRMTASPLCDVKGFTAGLEDALHDLAAEIGQGR